MSRPDLRAALAAAVLAAPALALAGDVHINATTYFQARQVREDTEAVTSIPLIEQLYINARDLDAPLTDGVDVVISAWARLDPAAATERALGSDVDLGYIQGKFLKNKLTFRLGRQLITSGASRMEQVDGVQGQLQGVRNVGLRLYAGVPVSPRFTFPRGDFTAGGRLSWTPRFGTDFGLSFNHVLDIGRTARQELGIDGRVSAWSVFAANASVLFSILEKRISEADVNASYSGLPGLFVNAGYRRTAPDLFVLRSSIFSVFSMDRRDEVGASAEWRPRAGLSAGADYYLFWVLSDTAAPAGATPSSGFGHRGSLHGKLAPGAAGGPWLGADVTYAETEANGFVQLRARIIHPTGIQRLTASGEAELTFFTHPVNGETGAYTLGAFANLGYELSKGLRVQGTALLERSPFYNARFELMAKLAYDLDVHVGGGNK